MTLSLKEGNITMTRKFYCPSRFTSLTDFDDSVLILAQFASYGLDACVKKASCG